MNYKEKIMEMLDRITNERTLRLLYLYIQHLYNDS